MQKDLPTRFVSLTEMVLSTKIVLGSQELSSHHDVVSVSNPIGGMSSFPCKRQKQEKKSKQMEIFIYSSIMLVLLLYPMIMRGSFGVYRFVIPPTNLNLLYVANLNYEDNLSFSILKKNTVLQFDNFGNLFDLPPQSVIPLWLLYIYYSLLHETRKVTRVSTLSFPWWWMNG